MVGGRGLEMDLGIRTGAELLADASLARQHAGRFRHAAAIVNGDLVEAALRSRARELETAAATLEAKAAGMLLASGPAPEARLGGARPQVPAQKI